MDHSTDIFEIKDGKVGKWYPDDGQAADVHVPWAAGAGPLI